MLTRRLCLVHLEVAGAPLQEACFLSLQLPMHLSFLRSARSLFFSPATHLALPYPQTKQKVVYTFTPIGLALGALGLAFMVLAP